MRTTSLGRKAASILVCLWLTAPIGRSDDIRNASEEHNTRPVTVADSIEMTQLGAPDYPGDVSVRFSPDRKHFVIVTKRGTIRSNTNDYHLLLFTTDKALRSPAPDVLVSLSSSSNRAAIHCVKWIDDHTIMFLGENPGELQQVYEVDSETRKLTKLTNHPTSVVLFAANSNKDRLFFAAYRPVEPIFDRSIGRDSVVVSNQPLADLLAGERQWNSSQFLDLFLKTGQGSREDPIPTPGGVVPYGGLWLSPSGRYLVTKIYVVDIPDIWKNYDDQWLRSHVHASPLNGDLQMVFQYKLIDIDEGRSEALLDAPLGRDRSEVLWSPDSNSVVVSGIYLPLNIPDADERKVRQSQKMIAEIKIPSLEIVPISSNDLHPVKWDLQSGELVVGSSSYIEGSGSNENLFAFEKRGTTWKATELRRPSREQNGVITVSEEEDLNTPPKVFATSLETGQKSLLLDLNPQFNELNFGRVQNITFRATDGHEVSAGLYLPPDYAQGKKNPLVIQTHGWHPERFWIDGPWPSAFAAQPLVGRGFVVLQLSEDVSGSILSTLKEAPKEAAAYEGAIDYLDTLGIVDRDRVGVIGFSRSGLGVEYALTHSKYHFAAATLAEPSDGGYFFYLAILPSFSWRWPDLEGINGGSPFGDGLASWLRNSPDFNLVRVTTPVREEAYSAMPLFLSWEWFAGLSRLRKPIDLIYISDGDHVLVRPLDRIISQQGNVDWFSFWLKGEEDADPAKADQYNTGAIYERCRKRMTRKRKLPQSIEDALDATEVIAVEKIPTEKRDHHHLSACAKTLPGSRPLSYCLSSIAADIQE